MTFRPLILTALLFGTGLAQAQTDSFTLPADLTQSPFNCKLNGSAYDCPAISLDKDTTLTLTAPVTMNVSGGFDADKLFTTVNNGNKLTMTVSGPVDFRKDLTAQIDLTVAGPLNFAKDAHFTGNITTAGNLTVAKDSWIDGNVVISGNLDMGNNSYITGTCSVTGTTNYTCTGATPPPSTRHHVRLNHTGTGLTCTPAQVTVYACSAADSGGTCTADTSGIAGNVVATYSGGSLSVPFTIAAGNSLAVVNVGVTVPGNATLSTSALSPAPANASTCWNSASGSNSCVIDLEDSGFVFDIPDHYSDNVQPFTVAALRKGSGSQQACVPAFSGAKNVTFSCSYVSNHVGTMVPAIGAGSSAGSDLACTSGSNLTLSLSFDSNGVANANVRYPDAGKINVQASSSGISGSDDFIAVPRKFLVQLPDNASYVAGVPFNVQIQPLNVGNNLTPSYGQGNAAALTLQRCQPITVDAKDGVLSNTTLSFANGVGTGAPNWSEVGNADIIAADANYLGQITLPITGTSNPNGITCKNNSGAAGPFRPHHFTTAVTRTLSFTYSAQPIPVTVAAFNANNGATLNFYYVDSATQPGIGFATAATLSAINPTTGAAIPSSTGALSDNAVQATAFTPGGTALATPKFTFANIFTAPTSIRLRAATGTPVVSVSSATFAEGVTEIRSGRLRLSNVFGSARQAAKMPVRAEYWTGQSWLLNSPDTGAEATIIAKSAIALSPTSTDSKATSADFKLVNGQGLINLSPPSTSGYVDLAINLGATNKDVACLPDHPTTTGSTQAWLRSQYGNCGANADPSARASFGIYAPGTNRAIHIRERFN